jgi:hypothetical protein
VIVYGHGGSMGYGAAGGASYAHSVYRLPQYSLERSEELRKSNARWARLEQEKRELRGEIESPTVTITGIPPGFINLNGHWEAREAL